MSSAPAHPDVRAACHSHGDGPESDCERLMAITLTTQWMLITGRLLGRPPLLHRLCPEALIDFWADDHFDADAQSSKD